MKLKPLIVIVAFIILLIPIISADYTSLYGRKFNANNFTFASSTYVEGTKINFNTSIDNLQMVLMTSMNVLMLDKPGQNNEVWARVKVDGNPLFTERIRSVSVANAEGSTGIKPFIFNITNKGSHNLTIDFLRTGIGSISINDIDLSLGKFRTTGNGVIHGEIKSSQTLHSNTTYVSIYDFNFTKTSSARTYISFKTTITKTTAGNVTYYIENKDTGARSPYFRRYLSSSSDIGSLSGFFISSNTSGRANYTLKASVSSGIATSNYTIIYFDLYSNNSKLINSNFTSNPLTNISSTKTYAAGTHNIANLTLQIKEGNNAFVSLSTTFRPLANSQTPTIFINATNLPQTNCYSKKERYLASVADVANAYIYLICENLTLNQNYTFNAWLKVPASRSVVMLDEALAVFETTKFDILEINQAPLPNSITNPENGTYMRATGNITWNAFSDPENDPVYYNISLLNSNGIFNSTIISNTSGLTQFMNYSAYSDGVYILSIKGCDNSSACASSNITFYIDNTKPIISIIYPLNQSYAITALTINATTNENALCYYSNGSANVSMGASGTTHGASYTAIQGGQKLTVSCNDTAGNWNSTSVSIFVHSEVPADISLNYPNAGQKFNSNTLDFNWTVIDTFDENVTCNLTLDSSMIQSIISINGTMSNYTLSNIADGIHYWNVTCIDSFSNTNYSETRNFTVDITPPVITNISVTPQIGIINSSLFLINATATDNVLLSNIWANISIPNGSIMEWRDFSVFYNATNIGRHNVTIFANDSLGNLANETTYFRARLGDEFNITVENQNSSITANVTFYVRNTNTNISNILSNGTTLIELPLFAYDIEFEITNNGILRVRLKNVNLSLNYNKSMKMVKTTTALGYITTYAINSTYIYDNATVEIYYGDATYSNENNLYLDICDNFNFTGGNCLGTWENDATATQDTTAKTFTVIRTNFSGFSIREVASPTTPSTPSGGSSGGATPLSRSCEPDWNCTMWGECINNKNIRKCVDNNNCNNLTGKPTESKNCKIISEISEENKKDIINKEIIEGSTITNLWEKTKKIIKKAKDSFLKANDFIKDKLTFYNKSAYSHIITILVTVALTILILKKYGYLVKKKCTSWYCKLKGSKKKRKKSSK